MLIKRYEFFNHEKAPIHWTVLFDIAEESLCNVLLSVPEHSRRDESKNPEKDKVVSLSYYLFCILLAFFDNSIAYSRKRGLERCGGLDRFWQFRDYHKAR